MVESNHLQWWDNQNAVILKQHKGGEKSQESDVGTKKSNLEKKRDVSYKFLEREKNGGRWERVRDSFIRCILTSGI